jgi:very-short-patch-repair endonuclease
MTTTQNRIPVTDPVRTISDLRRARPARGGATPGQLRQAIRQASLLGLPMGPDTAPDPTRSELEQLFLELCSKHRLPRPEINIKLGGLTVDFFWRRRRLAVETDGYRYHRGRGAFEDDRRRDLRLRALGVEVVRLTHSQVVDESERVAKTLHKRLAAT